MVLFVCMFYADPLGSSEGSYLSQVLTLCDIGGCLINGVFIPHCLLPEGSVAAVGSSSGLL